MVIAGCDTPTLRPGLRGGEHGSGEFDAIVSLMGSIIGMLPVREWPLKFLWLVSMVT
jgi:hypothetical protein